MFWNDRNYLDPTVRARLEEFEQELGLPLRVLYGRGRTFSPGDWTDTQRERALGHPTPTEAAASGVTLVFYASLNDVTTFRHLRTADGGDYLPYEAWDQTEAYPQGTTMYDIVTPTEPLMVGEPYHIGNVLVGELADRTFVCHVPLNDWLLYLDFDRWVRDPVMLTLDEEAQTAWQAAAFERNFKAFCELWKRGTNDGVANLEREIEGLMIQQSNASEQMARAKAMLRNKKFQLDNLIEATDEANQQATREEAWAKLNEHPKIERIALSGDTVMLDTVPLDITHPTTGQTVPLGKFRWSIQPTAGTVKVQNLTNRKGNYDHPHVLNNRPCFGDLGDTIFQLLNKGDLVTMVEMVFVFLGTINLHDDWSRRAAFWFNDENADERRAEVVQQPELAVA